MSKKQNSPFQKSFFIIFFAILTLSASYGQNVVINNTGASPDASAILDIQSSEKGLLIPRMSSSERASITSPADGLMVYDITSTTFWYCQGGSWNEIGSANVLQDLDADTKIMTEESPDEDIIRFYTAGQEFAKMDGKTLHIEAPGKSLFIGKDAGIADDGTNNYNAAFGFEALVSNTSGSENTATGYSVLFLNSTGSKNTAIGSYSLRLNTIGSNNTAIGYAALYSNTIGNFNTANGYSSLRSNTNGSLNTAYGTFALNKNTTGSSNTANGYEALYSNTTGSSNTANGIYALRYNIDGANNTANGYAALFSNITGSENTANGFDALYSNTTGEYNTANGALSLRSNTIGFRNSASGYAALFSNTEGNYNVANGYQALYLNTDGGLNTAIGYQAQYSSLSANQNTSTGYQTLYRTTTGFRNTATGYRALFNNTEGNWNTAYGFEALLSNIGGDLNTAFGYHALYNNTDGSWNVAVGRETLFNNTTGNSNTAIGYKSGVGSGALENATAIGANAMVNQSNSLVLGNNVNVGIGISTPSSKLQIFGGNEATLSDSSGYFLIGDEDWNNIIMDDNEIMARSNGAISSLYLQQDGGAVFVGGAVVHSSDIRLKKEITDLTYGLDEVLQLEPKAYYWKDREQEFKSIGLIAQEVQSIIKEIVHIKDDEEKSLSINYTELIPILINAVKEQEAKIQELEKQVSESKALEERIVKLEEIMMKISGSSEKSQKL